mgnify:CR=1 FL=1
MKKSELKTKQNKGFRRWKKTQWSEINGLKKKRDFIERFDGFNLLIVVFMTTEISENKEEMGDNESVKMFLILLEETFLMSFEISLNFSKSGVIVLYVIFFISANGRILVNTIKIKRFTSDADGF